jgi:hypothetical protein
MEIITDLMSANAGDATLVELCAKVLANIDDHMAHFNLEQHLQLKKLDAVAYYEKFYHLCYIINPHAKSFPTCREWRNTKGEAHCTRLDKDGKILPARTLENSTVKMWMQNGVPCSPGFDEFGHTLPTSITFWKWHLWENDDEEEHRLEVDKEGRVLPSSTQKSTKDWHLNGVSFTQLKVQEVYDAKYSKGEKILHKLRVSPDAKLRELCNDALNNIENHKKHFALSQYLQIQNLEAEEYYEEFHHLCYIITKSKRMQECKEWRNAAGQAHCTRKDKDGNVLPARIACNDNARCWMKDGIPWSPGFDKNGYTLPTARVSIWLLWEDEKGDEHRIEFDSNGDPLPSGIHTLTGLNTWFLHGRIVRPSDIPRPFLAKASLPIKHIII